MVDRIPPRVPRRRDVLTTVFSATILSTTDLTSREMGVEKDKARLAGLVLHTPGMLSTVADRDGLSEGDPAMSETISWSVEVSVTNGPTISESANLSVGAYDVVTVTVPGAAAGSTATTRATVQPSAGTDLDLLLIRAQPYDEKLKFTVAGAGGAADVPVDAPQLYLGHGVVALGGTAPLRLDFTSEMGDGNDATVTILAGRDAS